MSNRSAEVIPDLRKVIPPLADLHIDMTSLREHTLYRGRKPSLLRHHPEYGFALVNKDGTNSQMHQSDIDSLVRGNVSLAFLNGFTQDFRREGEAGTEIRGTDFYMPTDFMSTFATHDDYYRYLLGRRKDTLSLVTTQLEYAEAKQAGKIAVIRANEGCEGATLEELAHMRIRGVTSFGLKWNDYRPDHPLEIGVPSRLSETDADTGLTPWGVQVVREITSNGGMVDISHASDKTAIGMIENSIDRPAIATHSLLRSWDEASENMGTPSKRNLPIYVIDALDANGGSMGIPGSKSFSRDWDTIINFLRFMGDSGRLSMVKIGTDFDGMAPTSHLEGFDNSATLSTIFAHRMRSAGFSNEETYAVLYGNADRDLGLYLPTKRAA